MTRNNNLRALIVVAVVAWSLYNLYPPTPRDLVEHFRTHARNSDATLSNIVETARSLQKDSPERPYYNLKTAVGTNDLAKYFPFPELKNELNPNNYILNRLQAETAGKIKLGIDLQGGTSFIVAMDTNKLVSVENYTNEQGVAISRTNTVQGALENAVEVLRKRVDRFGVAEPIIRPAGDNQIEVQLPGLSQDVKEAAKIAIQKAAFLEFRLVHEDSDAILREGKPIPPGCEILKRKFRSKTGVETMEQYVVKRRPERGLTGSIVKNAGVRPDDLGRLEIDFTLNDEGTTLFGEVTRDNIGRKLAIVLDGDLQSAPKINNAIETGRGLISGGGDGFEPKEAFELATVLQNPLKAPLKLVYSTDVDPTLGKDSIHSGIKSAIIGVILVAAFMLVYYMLAGVVANAALMVNIVILLGVMCSIGTTLTLPGIAGIVLTIGMAVDANVLIFERIREELAAGKSIRGALNAGYDKAFGTIFDSNLTTLIASVILIIMGTGSVKGFGVTLTIGVTVSMFTALWGTRLIFDWLLEKNLLKNLNMMHLIRGSKIDFMKFAMPAAVASWLLILAGNFYGIGFRGKDVMGVEFTGGEQIIYSFDQTKNFEAEKIKTSVASLKLGEPMAGFQKDATGTTRTLAVTVRLLGDTEKKDENISELVTKKLQADFPDAGFKKAGGYKVGATMGAEILDTAIVAVVLALFFILVYVAFRYEFSFAVGAVIAIIHDLLMTTGWYFLAGRELNATTVAALLTIIGFSINDTIVIFDRIREDLKLGIRGSFRDIINQALNQTLSRTIITSGTVFLATAALYGFGGGAVNDFAFTFLIGILTGTYSSIYIASAWVLWRSKGHRPDIGGPTAGIQPGTGAEAKA